MNKNKILIVEDDIALRQLYQKRFEMAGYDVLTTGDGKESLSIAESENPNVILLDVLLPSLSGLEVLKILKNQNSTKKIPVVMMTAYDLDKYRLEAQTFCDSFFLKSDLRPVDFVNEVNNLLENKNK